MCGIIGVYSPNETAVQLSLIGALTLVPRGQESHGLAFATDDGVIMVPGTGPLTGAFAEQNKGQRSNLALVHVRYSTTGSGDIWNAGPVYQDNGVDDMAVGHNGNVINTKKRGDYKVLLEASDSHVIAHDVAQEMLKTGNLEAAVRNVMPGFEGAYSLIIISPDRLVAIRDKSGVRPLCVGELPGGGWVVASETVALEALDVVEYRHVEPGEMIVIDEHGMRAEMVNPGPSKACIFEDVYFASPASELHGRSLLLSRMEMGAELYRQAPTEADLVVGVPKSGITAGQGYAQASGIPYQQVINKNDAVGRSFISPTQEMREHIARVKLSLSRADIKGKRMVVVDDSIVRGTTQRILVKRLWNAGATEIHVRLSSPPNLWPCFYGIDTANPGELIAANKTLEEIRAWIGCTTLEYLELDRLYEAVGGEEQGFCTACMTGDYQSGLPDEWQDLFRAKLEVQQLEAAVAIRTQ